MSTMPQQTEIQTLYTQHALTAFAKQHVCLFFNGKYLLPMTNQPHARFDPVSGCLKFENGFTVEAQYIGKFDRNGIWQWAWADNTIPESVRQNALHLKACAEQHGIEWFSRPELSINWQQQQHLAAIVAVLCGADGYHIDQSNLPDSANRVFILHESELTSIGQNDSQDFHSRMIAEFAHYHEYVDKRMPYREAVATYLMEHGYAIEQNRTDLSAQRGSDSLHYVFNDNGRAQDWHAFADQTAGAPLQSDIRKPLRQMQLYPEARNIFVPEQAWLGKHLLPCFSLDLAALNPQWAGIQVHMLVPCEPEEGYIGETTEAAHTQFCASNWLAFHLDEQNRYRFLAAEDYFQAACEIRQLHIVGTH